MKQDRQQRDSTGAAAGRGRNDWQSAGLPARDDAAGIPVRDEAYEGPDALSRRSVLKLMAASALLAAGPGCNRKPYRRIVSMAETPEYQHPGTPLHYASTWTEGHVPYGMMIRCVDGRPVKIEGLPAHPLNRGTSSAAMQASLLSLYDPDRLRAPQRGEEALSWKDADAQITDALARAKSVVLVTRSLLGPAERSMIKRFLAACPSEARHFVHETVHDAPRRAAWQGVFGADGEVRPRLEKARVIVSLDADFLGIDWADLGAAADFARTRSTRAAGPEAADLSRLYVAESAMTLTGANADHRIPLQPHAMLDLVKALQLYDADGGTILQHVAADHGLDEKVLLALAGDLLSNHGRAVILAGGHLPAAVHAAVALLNEQLGAPGRTLEWNPAPPCLPVSEPGAISAALEGGADVLILMGVNPVYDWPGGGGAGLLARAKLTVGHGLHRDETLAACSLALSSSHNLESWNDASPLPGVHTLCQPVIAPLFDSRQEAESLLIWTRKLSPGDAELAECRDWHDFVRREWGLRVLPAAADPRFAWEDALRGGMVGKRSTAVFPGLDREAARSLAQGPLPRPEGIELVIRPHHALVDGRFSNSAWLQEYPDPVSLLVWDNALALGPAAAKNLGVEEGDLIEISVRGTAAGETGAGGAACRASAVLPVLVQPGVAAGTAVTTLGHGRLPGIAAGREIGVNTAPLLGRGETPRLIGSAVLKPAAGRHDLVRLQKTFDMHGRPIVLHGTAQEYARDPAFVEHRRHIPEKVQIDPDVDYSQGPKWVMAVDLGACTGCGACMIACQAENNIPVVGRDECANGREMHWMRVDKYYGGDPENPRVYSLPMPCQHCDNAPCETVCPVNATLHSPDGLNEQVYNRCVGTRYCANNCPYKVRRFNFFYYQKRSVRDPVQELAFNPQVTVRSRGVMEKCTFCIQRINEVKFRLKNEGKEIPDGAIRPACAQACPSGAIVFGNANDRASRVAALRASPLAYHVLEELNVRPAVTYLARVRNPHPDLADREAEGVRRDAGAEIHRSPDPNSAEDRAGERGGH